MIHPTYVGTIQHLTKEEAAKDLIDFWQEKDIYLTYYGYVDLFWGLGFIAGVIITDQPYVYLIWAALFIDIFLAIRSYWLNKQSKKSVQEEYDPIKDLQMQKEKMLRYRSNALKFFYFGIPILAVLKFLSLHYLHPDTLLQEFLFSLCIIFIFGLCGILYFRKAFATPIEEADRILSLED